MRRLLEFPNPYTTSTESFKIFIFPPVDNRSSRWAEQRNTCIVDYGNLCPVGYKGQRVRLRIVPSGLEKAHAVRKETFRFIGCWGSN